MLDSILDLIRREPARVTALVVSAVIAIASLAGFVLDEANLTEIVGLVLLIAAGGETVRSQVSPVDKHGRRR